MANHSFKDSWHNPAVEAWANTVMILLNYRRRLRLQASKMMKHILFFMVFIPISVKIDVFGLAPSESPEVRIPQGQLKGVILESAITKKKYRAFYGIPYAQPPLGSYRFKEPLPAKPWKGTLNATMPPPTCSQLDFFSQPVKLVGSEDCLFVNVFTPQIERLNDTKLLSVIVHIHGGAFLLLSGTEYSPERLMDRDVVYVSLNYRLGPIGFLSAQNIELPGNNGLKDQTEALKWVKRNIRFFGGDPEKITISGDSAGGVSVHFHLVSPRSKGLFNRVIAESGTSLDPGALNENPKEDLRKLSLGLGCPTTNTSLIVQCLRTLPVEMILRKSNMGPFTEGETDFFPYIPVIEPQSPSAFITKPVVQIIKEREAQDVPILMSFAEAEGLLIASGYLTSPDKAKNLEKNWNKILPDILNFRRVTPTDRINEVSSAIRQHYLQEKSLNESIPSFVKMFSDRGFFNGAETIAKLYAQYNRSPVYAYQFSYRGKKRSLVKFPTNIYDGATHIENTLYVLRVPKLLEIDARDLPMAISLVDLWINFASGDPRSEMWSTVKAGLPKFKFLDVVSPVWRDNRMKSYDDFSNAAFWKSLNLGDNIVK